MDQALEALTIRRWREGAAEDARDALAVEEPLEIRIRNRPFAVTMRTPGHDDELAAGFLLGEGLIRDRADIIDIVPCARNERGNVINIRPAPLIQINPDDHARSVYMTSSCGICGKASIDAVRTKAPPIAAGPCIDPAVLCQLPARMHRAQGTFAETGGLHAAALFDARGELLALREDVGRHNAVDKVIGRLFLDGQVPLREHILMVSGRASFELVQKAAMAGIALIAAVSAPSTLAAKFADESGQTLIGFLRPPRFNIYAHPQRVRA